MRTSLAAAGLIAAVICSASVSPAPGAPNRSARSAEGLRRQLLTVAERGTALARRYWWNPTLGWYDERLSVRWSRREPLVTLWSAFPLFETLDAIALASPTRAHKAAVRAFAAKAEQYYNPALSPVGGYAYYIGRRTDEGQTYFDDNGWWAIAFLDAYRATGATRYLADAGRALEYIAAAGWDPVSGGVWWDTRHLHKTAEPLAAAVYVGVSLYRATRQHRYLALALKYLAWADAKSWNAARHLYARSPTSPETLDYVQGMMIGAHLELCKVTGNGSYCLKAERLARASRVAFPPSWSWTPAADVIYLRFLLDLYRSNGDRRLYEYVRDKAVGALLNSRGENGIFSRTWEGRRLPGDLLRTEAANLSLFAWLATLRGQAIR